MAQTATLHIKIEPSVAKSLKSIAKRRKQTVGELVRQAVQSRYQADRLGLTDRQRHALEAYEGGYISIGKLAEAMGLTSWEARQWLNEHGVPQNTAFSEDDVANA